MPQDWTPESWSDEQARRIATEVIRLRGARSTQWLSDRTEELGFRVSRSVIADLENGRRRYVTIAELMILALALDAPPIALIYPRPYDESMEVVPRLRETKMWALQWFSGHVSASTAPLAHGDRATKAAREAYAENLRPVQAAREVWELELDKASLMAAGHQMREIAKIQRQIDAAKERMNGGG